MGYYCSHKEHDCKRLILYFSSEFPGDIKKNEQLQSNINDWV